MSVATIVAEFLTQSFDYPRNSTKKIQYGDI